MEGMEDSLGTGRFVAQPHRTGPQGAGCAMRGPSNRGRAAFDPVCRARAEHRFPVAAGGSWRRGVNGQDSILEA